MPVKTENMIRKLMQSFSPILSSVVTVNVYIGSIANNCWQPSRHLRSYFKVFVRFFKGCLALQKVCCYKNVNNAH